MRVEFVTESTAIGFDGVPAEAIFNAMSALLDAYGQPLRFEAVSIGFAFTLGAALAVAAIALAVIGVVYVCIAFGR